MNVKGDIVKIKAKLAASKDALESIKIAFDEQCRKKLEYQKFIEKDDDDYDSEVLLRGIASIDTNIASLEQVTIQEKTRQEALENELCGLEALARIQADGRTH